MCLVGEKVRETESKRNFCFDFGGLYMFGWWETMGKWLIFMGLVKKLEVSSTTKKYSGFLIKNWSFGLGIQLRSGSFGLIESELQDPIKSGY